MFEDTKSLFASKTLWGVAISLVALGLKSFGYEISAELQGEMVDTVLTVVQTAGLVYAGYGRVVATKSVGKK